MNRTIVAAILTMTAAVTGFAQEPSPNPNHPGRGDRTPPTTEQMVERRVQMLTNRLTLDTSQQAQAKTIFTDEAAALKALQPRLESARDALTTAVKAGASDAQIDQLSAAVGVVQGQAVAIHAKSLTKFRLILNATQKEKLDSMGDRFGSGRGFGGPPRH